MVFSSRDKIKTIIIIIIIYRRCAVHHDPEGYASRVARLSVTACGGWFLRAAYTART
jgi:hypothetical protein